jgi:hypothetical protein
MKVAILKLRPPALGRWVVAAERESAADARSN